MVEITLVIVHQNKDVSDLIKRLDEIAIYNNTVEEEIKHEPDDYQVTLYYYFANDSKVIDFAEESIADVTDAILSTIQRVNPFEGNE
ncbi:MAG: hypothetical protein AAFS12_16190 [Cyanobacteria bacterium J06632_19]